MGNFDMSSKNLMNPLNPMNVINPASPWYYVHHSADGKAAKQIDLRMTIKEFEKAKHEIVAYFTDPGYRKECSCLFVSLDEFENAIGKISPEADKLLGVIVSKPSAHAALKSMQTEGDVNNFFVSLRDLYALRRGTGYNGEDISREIARFKDKIEWTDQ